MSILEHTAPARLGRRTKDLVKRLRPDEIAIIDHSDLDRVSAEELADARVRVVVNVSRGGLIDQAALAAALGEGRLGGAGLDVLQVEPPPSDDPIMSAPNVVLSPHFAWHSEASDRRMREMSVDAILDYLDGREVTVGRLAVRP